MKKIELLFIVCCMAQISLLQGGESPKVVNPKDQTDIYGIPTDTDEVEEEQELKMLGPQKC